MGDDVTEPRHQADSASEAPLTSGAGGDGRGRLAPEPPLPTLPARPDAGHKGTFGTVCVVGGQSAPPQVMLGGPAFSALAALRCGAGLAILALPAPILVAGLGIAPSATGLALPVDQSGALHPSSVAEALDEVLGRVHCLAIGPGLGSGEPQRQVVARLLSLDGVPMVVDADALNCLAAIDEVQRDLRAQVVLTPHPGEFRRLAESLRMSADLESATGRSAAALDLSRRLGCITVLKGHRTVVSDGLNTWTCSAGGPCLATAGSGDVLTGVIASLVGQFHRSSPPAALHRVVAGTPDRLSLFDCARLGVEIHARAGDLWAARHGSAGMLAGDLIEGLPEAVRALRSGGRGPSVEG